MKKKQMRSICLGAAIVLSCFVVSQSKAHSEPLTKQKVISSAAEFKIAIPDFADTSDDKIEDITNNISLQQRQIGRLLLWQLQNENKKLSNAQKAGIINALGDMRYINAVDILIDNINFQKRHIDMEGTVYLSAAGPNRYPYVARTALEMIGEPASSYIIDILGNSPSQLRFDFISSRVDGFAEVICVVDGSRYGLLKLEDCQQAATDPQIQAQYQMVIDRFKKIMAWTQ